MRLRPRTSTPIKRVEKLLDTLFGKDVLHRLDRIFRNLVEQLYRGGTMRGGMYVMVRFLNEKTALGILQSEQRLERFGAFFSLGKTADRVEDVERIGASVLVYAHLARSLLVLPKIARICAVSEIVALYHGVYFIDKRVEIYHKGLHLSSFG